MKRSQPPNQFELETLEPRILLSGDLLVGLANTIAPDKMEPFDLDLGTSPLNETLIQGEIDSQNTPYSHDLQYDPSRNIVDIFSGLDEIDPVVEQNGDTSAEATTDITETITDKTATVSLTDVTRSHNSHRPAHSVR